MLRSVTDETLAILKTDNQLDREKKKDVEVILGPLKQEVFDSILTAAKAINDYHQSIEDNGQNEDGDEEEQVFRIDDDEDDDDD